MEDSRLQAYNLIKLRQILLQALSPCPLFALASLPTFSATEWGGLASIRFLGFFLCCQVCGLRRRHRLFGHGTAVFSQFLKHCASGRGLLERSGARRDLEIRNFETEFPTTWGRGCRCRLKLRKMQSEEVSTGMEQRWCSWVTSSMVVTPSWSKVRKPWKRSSTCSQGDEKLWTKLSKQFKTVKLRYEAFLNLITSYSQSLLKFRDFGIAGALSLATTSWETMNFTTSIEMRLRNGACAVVQLDAHLNSSAGCYGAFCPVFELGRRSAWFWDVGQSDHGG